MEEPPVKTAKQLEKEAKKLAKLEKFKQKQDQKQNAPKEEVCVFQKINLEFYFYVQLFVCSINV